MIKKLRIERFKSFKEVELKLGGLNLFIGTNASGKSNFLDALRVLQGIGYGFTFREILDGKPRSATSIEWEAIRGGSQLARFLNGGAPKEKSIKFVIEVGDPEKMDGRVSYTLDFDPKSGQLTGEQVWVKDRVVFDTYQIEQRPAGPLIRALVNRPGRGKKPHVEFDRSRPILGQLNRRGDVSEEHGKILDALVNTLSNTQRIDPVPEILRGYSKAQSIRRMGERGENFAALVKTICEIPEHREAFVAWLRELRPAEVDEVTTLEGALHEPLFALREGTREFPAPVLSDGTLRFAAITAAFFQPDMPAALTIEEIEKGIHASRLRLLLELLKSQASRGFLQVMATTHSRSVLDWLGEQDYATTFFCHRNPETGESRIVPLSEIPNLMEAAKKEPLGDLFAENWLEAAV